jgi:hypothetical protein
MSAVNRVPLIAGTALLLPLLALLPTPAARAASFQSAAVCAECHPEIHRTWQSSGHATAFTDPAFQIPYERVRRADPRRALPCEQCHNPMRFLLSPRDPRAAIFSREGVTCDFCHSVESVSPGGPFPRYRARPGAKFGPRGGTGKSPHGTEFSGLHITSGFCAGCHEYRNEHGTPILTTASEWEESFYRGTGVHCQFCHLPQLFDARFIEGKRQKGPLDHAMVGGHSRERLARAIPMQARLTLSGREARVEVSLKNERIGHATPTGLPTHRIRLVATLHDASGNDLGRREEVFERLLGDGNGKPMTRAEEIFLDAREVLKDNRIKPKENRQVRFSFPVDNGVPAAARVSLVYEMSTPDIAPSLRHVEIPIAEKVVTPEAGGFHGKAVILLAAAGLAILVWAAFRRKRPA